MVVKLVESGAVLNIISASGPQQGCSYLEKDSFLEELESMVRQLPESEKVIVGADLNWHIGQTADGFEDEHGGCGYGSKNEDGERILELAQSLQLLLANTGFTKKEHLRTYESGKH